MLSDRAYLRDEYPARGTSVLTWMVCALISVFVIDQVLLVWLHSNLLEGALALSPQALRHGQVWTLLTYTLLHQGIWHLVFNGLGLYLIGRELIGPLGSARFLGVSVAAAILGGLAWLACHFQPHGPVLVGASGIVASLFIVFACLYPEREVTFLVFFFIPVTLKPKLLAWILLGIDLVGFLFSELIGGKIDTGIAHSAHLGGMLAGWLFFRYFYASSGLDRPAAFAWPAWLRRRARSDPAPNSAFRLDLSRRSSLRSEVDRILDKINSHGFGALTDQEKRLLDEAKDLLSRR